MIAGIELLSSLRSHCERRDPYRVVLSMGQRGMGPCVRRDDSDYGGFTALQVVSLRLAGELLHRDAEVIGKHGFDDLRFLGIELLPGRRDRGLIDQRFGA